MTARADSGRLADTGKNGEGNEGKERLHGAVRNANALGVE